jgi:hypothetical protein
MSVVGATDWFNQYVTEHQEAPGDDNLVLEYYPVSFLNEIAAKIGPSFYGAMHTDLGYLLGAVDLRRGKWELSSDAKAVGSALPFTQSSTPMVPPQKYEFSQYNHPSIQEWVIQQDGSVRVLQAGYLTFGEDELVEKDGEDMIIAPAVGKDFPKGLSGDTEIDTLENEDLEEWLRDFGDASSAPNFAVCLNQQVYLNRDIPGPQVGLLLKQVGRVGNQSFLVKVGLYFTRASRAWDISAKPVDWIIL